MGARILSECYSDLVLRIPWIPESRRVNRRVYAAPMAAGDGAFFGGPVSDILVALALLRCLMALANCGFEGRCCGCRRQPGCPEGRNLRSDHPYALAAQSR